MLPMTLGLSELKKSSRINISSVSGEQSTWRGGLFHQLDLHTQVVVSASGKLLAWRGQ